jgi:pyruvate/2-oxoglutarate dehydrogenase complex dihydrolipoamide dehydrogenase (E3) component
VIKVNKPDQVILATGSLPFIPNIEVKDNNTAITAVDLLSSEKWVGSNVAVIGGGMVGCEVVDFLAEYGKNITIFEMLDKIATDMWVAIKINRIKRLK